MTVRFETVPIGTDDGWTIVAQRSVPAERRAAPPVLLLHGFGANGWCFHDPSGPSLGRHLARQGREVWIPNLRGSSSSTPPTWIRGARAQAAARRRVTLAEKLARDLPAVVTHMLAESGSRELDAVGHSLGGTLLYALAASPKPPPLRRLVALAAAIRYGLPLVARVLAAAKAGWTARPALLDPVPLRLLCRLGARAGILLPAHEHFNVENVERATLLRMMRHGVEDATLAELGELARWTGGDTGGPWGSTLRVALGRIGLPLLLLGGTADRHVSPSALDEVVSAWGGAPRRLQLLGRQTGCELDYGHADLLLGRRATTEVFPIISDWLARPRLTD